DPYNRLPQPDGITENKGRPKGQEISASAVSVRKMLSLNIRTCMEKFKCVSVSLFRILASSLTALSITLSSPAQQPALAASSPIRPLAAGSTSDPQTVSLYLPNP